MPESPAARQARELVDKSVASDQSRPETGTDTITIACKLPNGLRIDRYVQREVPEPGMGRETRMVKMWVMSEDQGFVIRGTAQMNVPGFLQGEMRNEFIPGGYVLSHGCPRDLWEDWLKHNQNSPLVRNHIIFAADHKSDAHDEAIEHEEVRSGLEPLDSERISERIPRLGRELEIQTMPGHGQLGKQKQRR